MSNWHSRLNTNIQVHIVTVKPDFILCSLVDPVSGKTIMSTTSVAHSLDIAEESNISPTKKSSSNIMSTWLYGAQPAQTEEMPPRMLSLSLSLSLSTSTKIMILGQES